MNFNGTQQPIPPVLQNFLSEMFVICVMVLSEQFPFFHEFPSSKLTKNDGYNDYCHAALFQFSI